MSPVESDEQDLTRKERREQARAQRKAVEEQAAASAARRTRLTQLGIVVAVVVVAVVVIVVATGGGSKKAVSATSKAGKANVSAVSSLVGGIPQSGNALGSPTAPATLQYFGDLQCPICKTFTLGALEGVINKWVRPGKLRIEYRSMETATKEPEVFKTQQIAALAAGKQNKAWDYIELFYHDQGEENSGYVNESFLQGLAQQIPGLSLAQWTSDRSDPALANQVASDVQAANNLGLGGTPAFLIGKTGGAAKHIEPSITEASSFDQPIEAALKG
jgi:protein-disulfide isomerase